MSEMMYAGTVPEWTLGWRMQRALAHADLSVEQMGDELGVSRSTISRWLNDRGGPPRIGYLKLWALRTGVPLEWLAGGGFRRAPFWAWRAWRWLCRDLWGPLADDEDYETGLELPA